MQLKIFILSDLHIGLRDSQYDRQEPPDLPFLLDDGDMRHNSTLVLEDDDSFQLMQWKHDEHTGGIDAYQDALMTAQLSRGI